MDKIITPKNKINANISLPGDKSISHRSLILASIVKGKSEITNVLEGDDVQRTINCLVQLGVSITKNEHVTHVESPGLQNFTKGPHELDCGNSGTTMRLLMGLLAGIPGDYTLIGDSSLSKRPMDRVKTPLEAMGANITLTDDKYAPVVIKGKKLKDIDYNLEVFSAQVKSAIMLAALTTEGDTRITGSLHTRDHTERLMPLFNMSLEKSKEMIVIPKQGEFKGATIEVPGDPSSASFWMAAGIILKNSWVQFDNISLNPTRGGFLKAIKKMGVNIMKKTTTKEPEPIGRMRVGHTNLKGITVPPQDIPILIDEIPILCILACYAKGVTTIKGAGELRHKETDRLSAISENLKALNIEHKLEMDELTIKGPQVFKGGVVDSFGDHRIAMSFAIGGLLGHTPITIKNAECVSISYPHFFDILEKTTK
jgi:3-phosphoshikimate 1-carboxyvinyltransferase